MPVNPGIQSTSSGSGNQGGTTGATTNALVKATGANTLGDTAFFETTTGILQIGGKTSSFPAITNNVSALRVVLADGTNGGNIETTGSGDMLSANDVRASRYLYILKGGHYVLLDNPVEGVLNTYESNGTTYGWVQNLAGSDYATADQTVDSTTLTADDTVSVTLKAARKYKFTYVYYYTPGDTAADGLKFDLNGGTATMTGFEARVRIVDNAGQDIAVTNSRMTALNTAVSVATVPTTAFTLYVDGFCEVNGAGTMIANFAKVADAGTGITKKKYSHIDFRDYP